MSLGSALGRSDRGGVAQAPTDQFRLFWQARRDAGGVHGVDQNDRRFVQKLAHAQARFGYDLHGAFFKRLDAERGAGTGQG